MVGILFGAGFVLTLLGVAGTAIALSARFGINHGDMTIGVIGTIAILLLVVLVAAKAIAS